jgi:hypothetical protein
MSIPPTNPPAKSKLSARIVVGQFLRWVPLAAMVSMFSVIGALMLRGGLEKITGWYLLPLVAPILGLSSLMIVAIYIYRRRNVDPFVVMTTIVSLICLLPSIMWFLPIT